MGQATESNSSVSRSATSAQSGRVSAQPSDEKKSIPGDESAASDTIYSNESNIQKESREKSQGGDSETFYEPRKDGIPATVQVDEESSRTPTSSQLSRENGAAASSDEENQEIKPGQGVNDMQRLYRIYKVLKFIQDLISILCLISFSLILIEIIIFMVAIQYDFVGYFLR